MKTKTAIITGIVAALLLAAVLAILLTRTTSKPPPSTAKPPNAAACSTTPADSTMPTAPPSDLAWKSLGPVFVPTSRTYGPARYKADLWTCYRHDPMGSVLATYEIEAAVITADWRQVAIDQFVPGPGQQTFITDTEHQTIQPPQPDQIAQPVGSQIVSYTPNQATIETLADAGNVQYQATENTVAWSQSDWKMLLSPGGSGGPDPQTVNSTDGFILWGDHNG